MVSPSAAAQLLPLINSDSFVVPSSCSILLTGATGYIASHTWIALQEAGFQVVGIDNFANSSARVLQRLETLSGQPPRFIEGDVRDPAALDACFALARQQGQPIGAVVHFAALKSVADSVQRPLDYFDTNVGGLLSVCQAMDRHGVSTMVFSSSATVYGQPDSSPIPEDAPFRPANPYGRTKLMGEDILRAQAQCGPRWTTALLRYFNPVGAHPSGQIGEDPRGTPGNLMPYVAQVAAGRRPHLSVFGNDYDTPDGTGVRDYIHVCDLAEGHVAALRHLFDAGQSLTVNLGTGQSHSVLEVARAYERASGRPVPLAFAPRRAGDVAAYYADPSSARRILGWQARRTLDDMCTDSWRWQSLNPRGYED